jgi:alanine racemase
VVKADSYGLGAAACARRLAAEGAETFFVARAREGVALREALGDTPTIYVLDGCVAGRAGALRAASLRPVLNTAAQVADWRAAGGGACGLQIDTGMNRLGFRIEDAPEPFEGLELVMSHLACADAPAEPMNARQRDAFASAAQRYPGTIRSFANSGGAFLGAGYAFDALRPGVCLYGGGPEGRPDARIRPVATLTAEVLQVRDVPAGESVGYSRGFVADRPTRIATCAAGYADGVMRGYSPRGEVFAGGALRQIVGRVSMDVCAVDVTDLDVAVGDRIELFGPNRMLDDAAAAAGTIAYELLTSITTRVPRAYVG